MGHPRHPSSLFHGRPFMLTVSLHIPVPMCSAAHAGGPYEATQHLWQRVAMQAPEIEVMMAMRAVVVTALIVMMLMVVMALMMVMMVMVVIVVIMMALMIVVNMMAGRY